MKCSAVVGKRLLAAASLAFITWFSSSVAFGVPYLTTFGVNNDFVEPTMWAVGDADSTYQEWDNLGNSGDNPSTARGPDAPNPRGLSFSGSSYFGPGSPVIQSTGPVFNAGMGVFAGMVASSTHNFYALDIDVDGGTAPVPPVPGVAANIYNYGVGGPGEGTYVRIQTGMSLNDGASFVPGSLGLVDITTGLTIPGGASASATVTQLNLHENLTVTPPDAASQTVDYEELLHEFFLPDYFGDFRVEWDQEWSTVLDVLRVDTFIGPAPLEAISPAPEPASAVAWILMFGTVGLVRRNRRARATKV
jgi:hypothetical protein